MLGLPVFKWSIGPISTLSTLPLMYSMVLNHNVKKSMFKRYPLVLKNVDIHEIIALEVSSINNVWYKWAMQSICSAWHSQCFVMLKEQPALKTGTRFYFSYKLILTLTNSEMFAFQIAKEWFKFSGT